VLVECYSVVVSIVNVW